MPRYSEREAREAIAASSSWAESIRRLGLRTAGGNVKLLKRWAAEWNISTQHFDPDKGRARGRKTPIPLEQILVERSTYSRGHLKGRLYSAGLKRPECELCGQGETWRGQRMAMILDHINGVPDDHRIENLRILCPNCAATLETHCGRKNKLRPCATCGTPFSSYAAGQRHCSQRCGGRGEASRARAMRQRRAERPPREQLLAEIAALGYSAVGRRYGVSDNAIRKWVRAYERESAAG